MSPGQADDDCEAFFAQVEKEILDWEMPIPTCHITKYRIQARLTREALAERLGVPEHTVYRWEEHKHLSLYGIARAAHYFGVDIGDLVTTRPTSIDPVEVERGWMEWLDSQRNRVW